MFLVSGGFRVIIEPIAKLLNIPSENVYANTILHKVSMVSMCSLQTAWWIIASQIPVFCNSEATKSLLNLLPGPS